MAGITREDGYALVVTDMRSADESNQAWLG